MIELKGVLLGAWLVVNQAHGTNTGPWEACEGTLNVMWLLRPFVQQTR